MRPARFIPLACIALILALAGSGAFAQSSATKGTTPQQPTGGATASTAPSNGSPAKKTATPIPGTKSPGAMDDANAAIGAVSTTR